MPLVYRATDRYCIEQHGLRPLSVSADRIAHAAFRAAALLARLGATDRSGEGQSIEIPMFSSSTPKNRLPPRRPIDSCPFRSFDASA